MHAAEVHEPASESLVRRAADMLRGANAALALSGAGISTPSGIPDFRSPGSGLWEHVDPYVVASIFGFSQRPEAFYSWIQPLARRVLEASPNPAHVALARLEAGGMLRSVITQNIDGLHQRAGSQCVHELHGHLRRATCVRCGRGVSADGLIAGLVECHEIPRCVCGGVLKPDVVLFGEMLPADVWAAAEQDIDTCDLLLVAGSSLEVVPASDLPLRAKSNGARIIIVNYEHTAMDGLADLVIHDDVADVLPRVADLALS